MSFAKNWEQFTTYDIRRTRRMFGQIAFSRMSDGVYGYIYKYGVEKQVLIKLYYDGMLWIHKEFWWALSYRGQNIIRYDLLSKDFVIYSSNDEERVYRRKPLCNSTKTGDSLMEYVQGLR